MLNFKENYYSFKNGEKLFAAAMQGIPDRVPVYAQLHEFAMNELGVLAKDFYTTPEILIPGCLEISERYGIDVAFLDYDVYNIEVEGLGQEVIFFDDHIPDVDRSKPFITGPDDLKKIKTPDFDTAGRFSKVIEMLTLFEKLTDVNPILQFCAPFSMAANLCGIEKLIMGIFKNPGFIRDLFDAIVEEVLIPWIMYQKKYFPNASSISGSDATASLPILNMRILEEWVVPYILRLRDACGQEVNVPNWVGEKYLKKPEELLMLKLQASPDYIEGQDPDGWFHRPQHSRTSS